MSRTIRIILAVVVVAAILGYKLLKPEAPTNTNIDTNTGTAMAETTAANATPVKLRTLGKIAFRACSLSSPMSNDSIEAQCATFPVPEDRSQPSGRKIDLNIAWLPATSDADQAPDPVFFLAGGPGQAAV
ncbi:MAG: alpha/beta hydrolase, partial [Thermomonas sp.]